MMLMQKLQKLLERKPEKSCVRSQSVLTWEQRMPGKTCLSCRMMHLQSSVLVEMFWRTRTRSLRLEMRFRLMLAQEE
jgi:hypothetical protein